MGRQALSLLLVLPCLGIGCRPSQPPSTGTPSVAIDRVDNTDSPRAQIPIGGRPEDWGHLPFRIAKVYEKQSFIKAPPFHGNGGDWTFFDCHLTEGTAVTFTVGVLACGDGKGRLLWGKAILAVPDRQMGEQLVGRFAQAFHTQPPRPRPSSASLEPLVISTAVLGENLRRAPEGGFSGTGGGWTATKWFPQEEGLEAEVFFNYNLQSGEGEFSEKDSDYRKDLVTILASSLRDGPRPERTPATDSNLTDSGPQIKELRCLLVRSCRHYSFSPGGKYAVYQDETTIRAVEPSRPELCLELARFEHAPWGVYVLDDDLRLLVVESLPQRPDMMSSEDPTRIWWVEAAGKGKKLILGPEKGISLSAQSISPDHRFVAIEKWRSDAKANDEPKRVRFLGPTTGSTKAIDLPDESLAIAGWRGTGVELRAVLMTNRWKLDDKKPQKVYLADPVTGKLTREPNLPALDEENRPLSPDGKHRVQIEGQDRLVVANPATDQRQVFIFHDDDRPFVSEGCVQWASPRYLLFYPRRLALIDITTMKMSYPTKPDGPGQSSRYLFDPKCRWVLCQKRDLDQAGLYLGRVVLPEQEQHP